MKTRPHVDVTGGNGSLAADDITFRAPLTGSLQENVLTLLCTSDAHCERVRHAVPVELFSTFLYRDFVSRVYVYIDQFKRAPVAHLPDLVEDLLQSDDANRQEAVRNLLHSIAELGPGLNEDYVLSQLGHFVQQQRLKSAVTDAAQALQNGDVQRAQRVLQQATHMAVSGEAVAAGDVELETVSLRDVKLRPVHWLWKNRIPRGTISAIVGDPGTGKSTLTLDFAARISTGAAWPDGAECERGSVLFVSAEDDAETTLGPRAVAAGADKDRIHIHQGTKRKQPDGTWQTVPLTLADLDAIERKLRQIGDIVALVFDPGSAFCGATDTHRNASVRGLLGPVAEMAARTGVAVILIDHMTKDAARAAIYRYGGSIAWVAAARAVWVTIRKVPPEGAEDEDGGGANTEEAEDPGVYWLPLKCNLAPDPGGLAYRIVGQRVREVGNTEVARVAWSPEPVTITAAEALAPKAARASDQEPTKVEAAVKWLRQRLASGPVAAGEALAEAEQAEGLSKDAVSRAREFLKVTSAKDGHKGCWVWALPEQERKNARTQERTARKRPLVKNAPLQHAFLRSCVLAPASATEDPKPSPFQRIKEARARERKEPNHEQPEKR